MHFRGSRRPVLRFLSLPIEATTQLIAARDSLLVLNVALATLKSTGMSGANSTAPQGGPGAAPVALGLFT
jgi:hypothetical protein